ncbi:MAG: DUF2804 domain-containing protein [Bacilli bacterium]|nr:DUF2804 domain-containing protein [Bacilli bacterium]
MEKQHQLQPGPLLDAHGKLNEAGYAYSLIKEYNRKQIHRRKLRIKEWDYYFIGNINYGVAFTIADNSYMWMVSASFLNFSTGENVTVSPMGFFSCGRLHLPGTSKTGNIVIKKRNYQFQFLVESDGTRRIIVNFKKFGKTRKPFEANLKLEPTIKDSMVIATPFDKPGHFYYNQKMNLLNASGYVRYRGDEYRFEDAYGVLDWGRGIWTYKNTWYWSSVNTEYHGYPIGWNFGYGFGDTSAASENMFFYNGKAYKLNDVRFHIPQKNGKDSFMEPWSITSLSGDINIHFTPSLDRKSDTNALLIRSNQHQVFGLFTGNVKVNGQEIHFENLPGFAEKVYNRW